MITCNDVNLARLLLYQSGPLTEFGDLEPGDQIEIVSFKLDIFSIEIKAKLGDVEKTFYLKAIRDAEL